VNNKINPEYTTTNFKIEINKRITLLERNRSQSSTKNEIASKVAIIVASLLNSKSLRG